MTAAFSVDQAVLLAKAIPDKGLAEDALGCVLEVFKDGEAYLVEFANGNGETIATLTLKGDALRKLHPARAA